MKEGGRGKDGERREGEEKGREELGTSGVSLHCVLQPSQRLTL